VGEKATYKITPTGESLIRLPSKDTSNYMWIRPDWKEIFGVENSLSHYGQTVIDV